MKLATQPKVVRGTHKRPTYLLAIPTLGMMPADVVIAFWRLATPINSQIQTLLIKNKEVADARNYACEYVLSLNPRPQWLFFLGDDMLPEWDAAIRLVDEMNTGKWDVLGGMYMAKQIPSFIVGWRDDITGGFKPGVHFRMGDVVPVDIIGMDFTFISVDMLAQLKPPYFETGPKIEVNNANVPTRNAYTEDVYFCKKIRALRHRIGLHTGVRVGHLDVKTSMVY